MGRGEMPQAATHGLPRMTRTVGPMKFLDRFEWTDGVSFVVHGARIGIRMNARADLDEILRRLPPGWEAEPRREVDSLYSVWIGPESGRPGDRRSHMVYRDAEILLRTIRSDQAYDLLEDSLHSSVAIGARDELFVHAGVVGWGGQAIVLPGRSRSGKTTLVEALVRAGATYYSDEFAVLNAQGRIYPYPRPLSIRVDASGGRRRCTAEEIGGRVGTEALPVGLVVQAEYRPGACWSHHRLSPAQAILALLANTAVARTRPRFALAVLQAGVARASAIRAGRGEARDAAGRILEYAIARRDVDPPDRTQRASAAEEAQGPPSAATDGPANGGIP